ncbi:TPA: hypothetical protein ACQ39K_004649, partial [Yersinia enterocolitica]
TEIWCWFISADLWGSLSASPAILWSLQYVPGNKVTKYPPWFKYLSEEEQNKLLSQSFFKNWLKTTTSLWPNISKIKEENENISKEILWRDDNRILFHGDEEGRNPHEIFISGLTPPEPMGSLKLRPGPHVGVLESFSYIFNGVMNFSTLDSSKTQLKDQYERYIYLTDAPGGISVDKTLKTPISESESEVSFPGGVKSSFIIGAFVYRISEDLESYENIRFQYNPAGKYSLPDAGKCHLIIGITDDDLCFSSKGSSEEITLLEPITLINHGIYRVRYKNEKLSSSMSDVYVNGSLIPIENDSFEINTNFQALDGMIIVEVHRYLLSLNK